MARDDLEKGNKVLLPPSVLAEVSQGAMPHPLLFRINSMRTKKTTYVGVLEFTAPEDICILPLWVSCLSFFDFPDFHRDGIDGERIDQYFPRAHSSEGRLRENQATPDCFHRASRPSFFVSLSLTNLSNF